MGENLVFGLIGFVLGGIVGGYLMGTNCARQYRKTIEQLENERDQLIEERRREASRASQGRLRALEEAEKVLNENLGITDDKTAEKLRKMYNGEDVDEDYDLEHDNFDFDDPFAEDDTIAGKRNVDDSSSSPDNVVDIRKSGFVCDEDGEGSEGEDEDAEPKIRMLTKKQYDMDFQVRESYTLTYYQEDGILVDSSQEVLHDQAEVLGDEAMEMIDETPEDALYIDNEIDQALYEVIIEHNLSYHRDVLGI